ncbi:MAG: hypothetical protein ACFFCW_37560 [Candidatus Hodarchaeota archaeon]
MSVRDRDKESICPVATQFIKMGFKLLATTGTSRFLREHNIPNQPVKKVSEGRPHIVDHIKNGEIHLVINTSLGSGSARDGYYIRRAALEYHVPYVTTVAGALAMASGVEAMAAGNCLSNRCRSIIRGKVLPGNPEQYQSSQRRHQSYFESYNK